MGYDLNMRKRLKFSGKVFKIIAYCQLWQVEFDPQGPHVERIVLTLMSFPNTNHTIINTQCLKHDCNVKNALENVYG